MPDVLEGQAGKPDVLGGRTGRPDVFAVLESSHRCAAIAARRSGSNFFRSFSLLPHDKRRAMTALYAFARQTDDFGDSTDTAEERQRHLASWRTATDRILQDGSPESPAWCEWLHEASLPPAVHTAAVDLLPALADSARRFQIPTEHLLEIIDGAIIDQHQTRYETFEDLERYCHLVASAVGLACMHIWQHVTELPRAAAIDCGVAFQLTNILRDLREDAARGRIYLPRECWAPRGLEEADFASTDPTPAMLAACAVTAARARLRYEHGWEVYESLHPEGRRMFSMIWRSYRMLLSRIEADPAAVFRRRVELRHRDRLRIVGSHFVGPLFRRLGDPRIAVPLATRAAESNDRGPSLATGAERARKGWTE